MSLKDLKCNEISLSLTTAAPLSVHSVRQYTLHSLSSDHTIHSPFTQFRPHSTLTSCFSMILFNIDSFPAWTTSAGSPLRPTPCRRHARPALIGQAGKETLHVAANYTLFPGAYQFNLLNPTGHVMHQQLNIQQLYALPTLYLCVLYLSENKQRLVPLTA